MAKKSKASTAVEEELDEDSSEEEKSEKKSSKVKDGLNDLIKHLQSQHSVAKNATADEKLAAEKKKAEIGTIQDVGAETRYYWDTGNYVLNYIICGNMLGGGWMGGKFTQLTGDPHTGKSLLVAQALADASKMEDVYAIALDSERALEADSISGLGGNPEKVIYYPIETVEEMMNSVKRIIEWKKKVDPDNKKMCIIGIDSLASLSSEHERAAPDKVDMTKAKKNRLFFRLHGNDMYRANITVLATNHLIANIGGYGPSQVTTGGGGSNYASSCTIQMQSTGKTEDKSSGEIVTTTLRPKVTKIRGRGGRLKRQCEIDFDYSKGIDRWSGMVEHLLKYNIVKKKGQGRYNLTFEGVEYHENAHAGSIVKTLKEKPELFKAINDLLYERVLEKVETDNMNSEFVIRDDSLHLDGFKEEMSDKLQSDEDDD